jgi:hypothetical protein
MAAGIGNFDYTRHVECNEGKASYELMVHLQRLRFRDPGSTNACQHSIGRAGATALRQTIWATTTQIRPYLNVIGGLENAQGNAQVRSGSQ